jgi:hypothetical protein
MIEKLKEELTIDELKDMVSELNSWNGSFKDLDYFENDEYFFEMMFGTKVDDAVRAVCYGDYKYMDDFVRVGDDGNLYSCREYEYEEEIEDNANEIIEYYLEEIDNMWDEDMKRKIKDIMEEE